MIAIPIELHNMLTFPKDKPVPILKKSATDQQKIIYADFITELLDKTCYRYKDDFLNHIKVNLSY